MKREKIRIGALISGGGTNLQAIIDACESGAIDAQMVFVGSDNPGAKGLARAEKSGIPTFVVDYPAIIKRVRETPGKALLPDNCDLADLTDRQHLVAGDSDAEKIKIFMHSRVIAEARMLEAMDAWPFDLLVLAGFMRNLTPYLIDRVNIDPANPRIMNIHPALLPAFPGVDGYGDTWRYGCKVGGCTVHFIDYGEDSGPIIGQKSFAIRADDTLDSIKKRGLVLEWQLYPECIQLFAEKRLKTVKMTWPLGNGRHVQRTVVKIAQPL